MAERGVHVVPYVHDLLPIERPEWFVPELVESFSSTVGDQLDHAQLAIANCQGDRGIGGTGGRPRFDDSTEFEVVFPGADLPVTPARCPHSSRAGGSC